MASNANYTITVFPNAIKACISGEWSFAIDLAYLTEMSLKMSEMNKAPWALYIDMRGLHIPESNAAIDAQCEQLYTHVNQHGQKVLCDRRNQIAECWIVDELEQAKQFEKVVQETGIKLGKFTDTRAGILWLAEFDIRLPSDDVLQT